MNTIPEKTTRFTLRDIPNSVVEKLDEITKKRNYQSRNQLIVDVLTQYVTVEDALFAQSLPLVVQSMCKSEINHLQESAISCIRSTALVTARLLKTAQRIEELIIDDVNSDSDYKNTLNSLNDLKLSQDDINFLLQLISEQ